MNSFLKFIHHLIFTKQVFSVHPSQSPLKQEIKYSLKEFLYNMKPILKKSHNGLKESLNLLFKAFKQKSKDLQI